MTGGAPVVVAGGGPVGLLLACELRLAGVAVVVLERWTSRNEEIRAGAIHVRTVETLDLRGLLDGMDLSRTQQKQHFAGLGPLDLRPLDSSHPYTVMIPQFEVERILEERATELGVDVRRGHELVDLRADDLGVTVDVRTGDRTYVLRTDWLVGCDGGRSTVRKLAGFDFPGSDATVVGRVGMVTMDEPNDVPTGWANTPTGMIVATGPRVVTIEYDGPVPDRSAPMSLAELQGSIERVAGTEVTLRDPSRLARFSDNTRQAAEYRRGRVLLAGDAAHVHSPFGGQGLNLGLQDAANLGWKLAAQILGTAPAGLLDSYHTERHPVGTRVLRITAAQIALMNPQVRIAALRELFEELLGLDQLNHRLAEMMVGLDIRYDMGVPDAEADPLLGRFAPGRTLAAAAGDGIRVPDLLRGGRAALIDLRDDPDLRAVAAGWTGRVDVVTAWCADPDGPDAVLVRPDGYVAWVVTADEDPPAGRVRLRAALGRWFGEPAPVHAVAS